jgi:AraC-like DNA-binding protein
VTEVGLSVGFSETSAFAAVFRKVTGQTPSRYHRGFGQGKSRSSPNGYMIVMA